MSGTQRCYETGTRNKKLRKGIDKEERQHSWWPEFLNGDRLF